MLGRNGPTHCSFLSFIAERQNKYAHYIQIVNIIQIKKSLMSLIINSLQFYQQDLDKAM